MERHVTGKVEITTLPEGSESATAEIFIADIFLITVFKELEAELPPHGERRKVDKRENHKRKLYRSGTRNFHPWLSDSQPHG